jgi:hypothetical protein
MRAAGLTVLIVVDLIATSVTDARREVLTES